MFDLLGFVSQGTKKLFEVSKLPRTLFTLVLIFCIILVNIFISYSHNSELEKRNEEVFLSGLEKMLDGDFNNFDHTWEQNWDLIEDPAINKFSFFGAEKIFKNDLNDFKEISKEWFLAFKPLSFYILTEKGFEHSFEKDKLFTDDLKDFFVRAESLISKTNNFFKQKKAFIFFIKLISPTFSRILDKAESFYNLAQEVTVYKSEILSFLGDKEKRKILILNQSSKNMNGLGGRFLTYVELEIFKGKFNFKTSSSTKSFYFRNKTAYTNALSSYQGFSQGRIEAVDLDNFFFSPCSKSDMFNFKQANQGFFSDNDFEAVLFLKPSFFDFFEILVSENPNDTKLKKSFEEVIVNENKDENLYKDSSKIFLEEFLSESSDYQTNWFNFMYVLINNLKVDNLKVAFNPDIFQTIDSKYDLFNSCKDDSLNLFVYDIYGEKANSELYFEDLKINIYGISSTKGKEVRLKYKSKLSQESPSEGLVFVSLKLPKNSVGQAINSDNLLDTSFERSYFTKQLESDFGERVVLTDQVESQKSSYKNLKMDQGNFAGYTFEDHQGNMFLGGYFEKGRDLELEFSFLLKEESFLAYDYFEFHNHVSSEEVVFTLGNGLAYVDFSAGRTKEVSNGFQVKNPYLLRDGLVVRTVR
jgi:hypothetical protein